MRFLTLFIGRKVTTPTEAPAEVPTDIAAASAAPSSQEEEVDCWPALDPVTVTAKDLWRAFHDNQVAAELAYGKRLLTVTGEVSNVDRDHKDRIRVYLKVSDYYALQAFFPEEARDMVAALRPSQAVRLLARIRSVDSGTATLEAEVGAV